MESSSLLDLAIRAARDNSIDIVRNVMIADPHLLDAFAGDDSGWKGWTVLGQAARYGRLEIVRHLLERGASVDGQGGDGYTPLILACAGRHRDVVELLLYRGADVDLRANDGMTAVRQSRQCGPPELFEMVVKVNTEYSRGDLKLVRNACITGGTRCREAKARY
jgi:ankyrin repeat protein